MAVKSSHSPVHINECQDDRLVVLTPEDQDRFVLSCRETVHFSKLGLSHAAWIDEVQAMLNFAALHLEKLLSESVKAAYAAPRDGEIVIFCIPKAQTYDVELSQKLTELDLLIAEKFQICTVDVLQVPSVHPDQTDCFIDYQQAKKIYGHD